MQINVKQIEILNKISRFKISSTRKQLASNLSQINSKRQEIRQLLAKLSQQKFSRGAYSITDLKLQTIKESQLRRQLSLQVLSLKALSSATKTLELKYFTIEQQQELLKQRSEQLQNQAVEPLSFSNSNAEILSVDLNMTSSAVNSNELLKVGVGLVEYKNIIDLASRFAASLKQEFGDRLRSFEICKGIQAAQFSFELITQQGNLVGLFIASSQKGKIKLLSVSGDKLLQLSQEELQRLTSALKLAGVEKVQIIKN